MKFPVYLWVPKRRRKVRHNHHFILISGCRRHCWLSGCDSQDAAAATAATAPQAPFDMATRNRTRRWSCGDKRASAPASNYFTFCKQTAATTRGDQQAHIKLISTLESRRWNCYFAWNRSTPCAGCVHIGVYGMCILWPGVPFENKTNPWYLLFFLFSVFCDKFSKITHIVFIFIILLLGLGYWLRCSGAVVPF